MDKIQSWRRNLLLVLAFASLPAFSSVSVELAQSVPLETTLAVPGVRSTQDVWVEMIKAAKKTIDLEQFYIYGKKGESLDPVLSAIETAASKGVQIRFLIDTKFYKNYPDKANELGELDNIEVRLIDYSPGVQHSKYFVVDGEQSFVGSANFDWLALSHIHEVGLHLTDTKTAADLSAVFEKDWAKGKPVREKTKPLNLSSVVADSVSTEFHVLASPKAQNPSGIAETLPAILKILDASKKSLKIQVYQYTTKPFSGPGSWTVLDAAIRKAAERGVHVQLMVDAVALKTGSKDLKALAEVKGVEVRKIIIPQWSGGHLDYARLVHSKYFVADAATAWVGTENWSKDYFTQSRNVGVTLETKEIVRQLGDVFDKVWDSKYASAP